MKFKKILSAVGVLGVAVPATLAVSACGTSDSGTIKISQREIADEINNQTYSIAVQADDEISVINNKINPTFIQEKLTDEIHDAFNQEMFQFNAIKIDDHDLSNDDLVLGQTIEAKINYNYGNLEAEETVLNIEVSEVTNEDVVDAINNEQHNYQAVKLGSTVEELKQLIIPAFTQEKLTGDVHDAFDSNKMIVKSVYSGSNHQELTDESLNDKWNLFCYFYYDYGTFKDQKVQVTLVIS